MKRRTVLKFIGGGALGTFLTPAPWKTLYDTAYWTQNWSWIPRLKYGANSYTATVSKICPSGAGVVVRTVDGRPVRALGNVNNPLSLGGITALAAAETQLMCSPARVKKPLKRTPDNVYAAISWDEAYSILIEKTRGAKSNIACISGDTNGSINDLLSAFLNQAGSEDFYLMPSDEQDAQIAFESMGGKGRIGYDVENADFIFAIGANYLESFGTVVRNRKDYAAKRQPGEDKKLTLAYANAAQNNTAAGADYWLPAKVGSELIVALGVAHMLIRNGARSGLYGYDAFAQLTSMYTPEYIEKTTGIPAALFIEATNALSNAKKPLVVVGSQVGHGLGALPVMAGIACNLLLAHNMNPNNAGRLVSLPFPEKALMYSDPYQTILKRNIFKYITKALNADGKTPEVLFVYDANPLYALPKNSNFESYLERSKFVVSFSQFMDETAMEADLILPMAMGFERFDDVNTPYGSGFVNYTVGKPASVPAFESKAPADVLINLANALGYKLNIANAPELIAAKARALGADMDSLLAGETYISNAQGFESMFYFNTELLSKGIQEVPQGLVVSVDVVRGLGTATTGIPPFATKIITNEQLVGNTMVAQMNKATANKYKVKAGNKLKLENTFGSVIVQVALFEGVQNDTLLVPFGLGHTAFDAFSQNKGDNIINLTGITDEVSTGLSVWSPMIVNATKV